MLHYTGNQAAVRHFSKELEIDVKESSVSLVAHRLKLGVVYTSIRMGVVLTSTGDQS